MTSVVLGLALSAGLGAGVCVTAAAADPVTREPAPRTARGAQGPSPDASDTASVAPPQTANLIPALITSIKVRSRGANVTRFQPRDTFFVDVGVSDGDGFLDVVGIQLDLAFGKFVEPPMGPAYGARYAWLRGTQPAWTLQSPEKSSWEILPWLCSVDTTTNSILTQTVTFAIIPGRIARSSSRGEWSIRATAYETLGLLAVPATATNFSMFDNVEFTTPSTDGKFAPGLGGQAGIPLVEPPSGSFTFGTLSNTTFHLRLQGADLVGDLNGDHIAVSNIQYRSEPGAAGVLSNSFTSIAANQPPDSLETGRTYSVSLTVDLPAGVTPQKFAGSLGSRIQPLTGGSNLNDTRSLYAEVVAGGLAADSAVAEVRPTSVVAGTQDQTFTAALRLFDSGAGSGANTIRVGLPSGYAHPVVSKLRVGGAQAAFTDQSTADAAQARVAGVLPANTVVEVMFDADVPGAANAVGAAFPVSFDDALTSVPPQIAREGDADPAATGDTWTVSVTPGPPSKVTITPSSVELIPGQIASFAAIVTDAHGNATASPVNWILQGAIGTLGPAGTFTALTPGTGRVIAVESSGLRDTSDVTVSAIPSAVRVSVDTQTPRVVWPGGVRGEVLRVHIVNGSLTTETLRSLRLQNRTAGPGTPAELDADWSPLTLWTGGVVIDPTLDAQASVGPSPAPAPVDTASMVGGEAVFDQLALSIAPFDSITLSIRGGASLMARDGDVLDVRVLDGSAFTFSPAATPTGSYPLDPPGGFTVDGMSAAQVALNPIPAKGVSVGERRRLALDVLVPSNGYQSDQLRRVELLNEGTATAGVDLVGMEVWGDDGDGRFDAGRDVRLGAPVFTGDRWQLTGLTRTIPVGGERLFVTVDVADLATEGRTVRLALAGPPDVAFGMASANDGPVDAEVANPFELAITTQDRVTLSAASLPAMVVHPGQPGVPVLALAATNSYAADRDVTALKVTNATVGPGAQAERDAECDRVTLRLDGDDDGILDDVSVDPPLGSAIFVSGVASFAGFLWPLPAGKTRFVFVTADVSLSRAADGDVLSTRVGGPLDLSFDTPSTLAAAWPVTSGAAATVDGMLAVQLSNLGAPAVTLGPGDGPAEALDVVVPPNGYASDVLQSVQLVNAGTAGVGDIAELRLWRDGGNGAFDAGAGDDADLGPLTLFNGAWQSTFLSEPLAGPGARLFVSMSVSGSPTDSCTVRLEIPRGGIATASGNGGPIDVPVTNVETQLLSTAPLVANLTIDPAASTIGATLTVRMTVRNIGTENVLGVSPSALVPSGTGGATPASGPAPASADVAVGAQQTFTWTYTAAAAGELRLSGSASGTGEPSGLNRRSLNASSNLHRVFTQADSVSLFTVTSMPPTVTSGQADIVPLTLTFTHSGAAGTSDVRVRSLSLRLEAEDGSGVVPADLLTRVEVYEGSTVYLSRTGLETSGSDVDLTLSTPLLVTRDDPVSVGVRFDLAAATSVPAFRVALLDSTRFIAEDATSGAPVTVRASTQGFPIRTELARVVAAATELRVAAVPQGEQTAAAGQADAHLARLSLENPGTAGVTSDVRFAGLTAILEDSAGTRVSDPRMALSRIRVTGPLGTLVDRPVSASDTSAIAMTFAPALTVPVNTPVDVRVSADLALGAAPGRYRLVVRDSLDVDARDPNSGARIPAVLAWHPLRGDTLRIQRVADTLRVLGIPEFPSTVSAGRPGVQALGILLRNPGDVLTGCVRLDSLIVDVLDDTRRAIAPALALDRVRVMWRGAVVATEFDPPATATPVRVPLSGVTIEAARTETLTVVVDVEPSASGFVELSVAAAGLHAVDANLGTLSHVVSEPGATLPLTSGLTLIEPAASSLTAGLESLMPAMVTGGSPETPAARLTLANTSLAGSGTIGVEHLDVMASTTTGARPIGEVVQEVAVYYRGLPWASSGPLVPTATSARVSPTTPLEVAVGAPETVELRVVPRTGATGRFRVGLDAAGIGIVQPGGAPAIVVLPAQGQQFPMWSDEAGFAPASLGASYSNYPNPFAAGRDLTRFVYYVPRAGRVTLRIWTARGEAVATVLENVAVGAGLRQVDTWDGRNGRGAVVINGVYVAELALRTDDGSRERVLRRVAVVR